jgi:hypothetical protein
MPWVLWATLGVLSVGSRREVAWLALFAAFQLLAGHAQTTWYSMLLLSVFSLWWLLTRQAHGLPRLVQRHRVILLVIGLALAAGIAAIQLLPTTELLLLSQRSGGVDYEFVMNFSYRPASTLNLLSPNIFGNPGDGSYILKDKGAFFEDAVYIGLIPLVSAVAAVVNWLWSKLRKLERPTYFTSIPLWLVVVVTTYILALGENSPVFPFLYNHVATFDQFQAPVRWHIWTVLGLSVLAGIGVGAWGRGHWLFFATRLAVAGCIGAAVLAALSPHFLPPDVAADDGVSVFIRAFIATGIWGALAGVLTLRQPEQPDSRWSFAVLLIIAADLGYAALGLNPTVPASFYDRLTPANQNPGRTYWPDDVEESVKYRAFLRTEDYRVATDNWRGFRASGLTNLNLLDRTYSLNNFDPLQVGYLADYLDLIESNPQQRDTLLQGAGVNAVFGDDGVIRPLQRPAARAWFTSSVCAYPGYDTMLEAIQNPDWRPLTQTHLVGGQAELFVTSSQVICREVAAGQILGIAEEGNAVVLSIHADGLSYLVLADTFYPGWEAVVDGEPSPVLQANLAFRSVLVPPGHHEIRFEYHPSWLVPGAWVTILSLLVLLVLFRTKIAVSNR